CARRPWNADSFDYW
nr:immunoglobulin heavy chain junction region [Macaca mulatta]MOX66899.1 immunoglobulin heavy chain junction region [Macaca mulatta]